MSEKIELPNATNLGLYVAFAPRADRIPKGCYVTACWRCQKLVGHWPTQSAGHEIICLNCANDIPQIRQHIDELAKARGD